MAPVRWIPGDRLTGRRSRFRGRVGGIVLLVLVFVCALPAAAGLGTVERVSVSSSGAEGNAHSEAGVISGDGRFAAFSSFASNLVEGDTNGSIDVFFHDRANGLTSRVSVDSSGAPGNDNSSGASISVDGRYVAFASVASNLVEGDTNAALDVFIHDRATGMTGRVSVSSSGTQGNSHSDGPFISADGRFVAFFSSASNLVDGDTNERMDGFVHDRATGTTSRVSVSSTGEQGNGVSRSPSISADGHYVAFSSAASNLVEGDTNAARDVFLHDRSSGTTSRVSVASGGAQANGGSGAFPAISADGTYIAFGSLASNLVEGDANETSDVFVYERTSGITSRVSVASSGQEANGDSVGGSIAADGRYVAFTSFAANLVAGDRNERADVFVHDRATGVTVRVPLGRQGNDNSSGAFISADGHHLAFGSLASNLVARDTNAQRDVFVHERP